MSKSALEFNFKLDNSDEILKSIPTAVKRALEACGMKAADYAAVPIASGGNCPVDTGRLRNSITYKVADDKTVYIGTNVDYAPEQELGGMNNKGHYFLTKACTEHTDEYKSIIKASLSNA